MPKLIITNFDGSTVKYGLNGRNFTIGRAENNDIVLPGGSCSNYHAVLKLSESGDFVVTDLDSTNHTKLNGNVIKSRILRHEDVLYFGDVHACYESEFPPAPTDEREILSSQTQRVSLPLSPPTAPRQAARSTNRIATGPRRVLRRAESSTPAGGMMTPVEGCFAVLIFGLVALLAFAGGVWTRHSMRDDGVALDAWVQSIMLDRKKAQVETASSKNR